MTRLIKSLAALVIEPRKPVQASTLRTLDGAALQAVAGGGPVGSWGAAKAGPVGSW